MSENKVQLWKHHNVLGWLTFIVLAVATYMVFIFSPEEKVMGLVQKIFYFHVSSAWIGFLAFFVVFVTGILYLIKKDFKYDAIAASSAEIGVVFTTIVLITGPIWGRSAWNTWWTWDARLTSSLVLWFIYIAYLLVRSSVTEEEKKARLSSVFGIVGFIDVPIVFFSIRWWNSIHPVLIDTKRGFDMAPPMLATFFVSLIAFTLLYVYLLQKGIFHERMKGEISEIKEMLRSKFN